MKQVLLCKLTKSFLGVATDDEKSSWIRKDFIKVNIGFICAGDFFCQWYLRHCQVTTLCMYSVDVLN